MLHIPALPFTLHRSNGVISGKEITSTVETIHGLLRVDSDSLVLQWRVQRRTDRVGAEIRSDRELDPVREASIPIASVSGAAVRWPRWGRSRPGRLVLTVDECWGRFPWGRCSGPIADIYSCRSRSGSMPTAKHIRVSNLAIGRKW